MAEEGGLCRWREVRCMLLGKGLVLLNNGACGLHLKVRDHEVV